MVDQIKKGRHDLFGKIFHFQIGSPTHTHTAHISLSSSLRVDHSYTIAGMRTRAILVILVIDIIIIIIIIYNMERK